MSMSAAGLNQSLRGPVQLHYRPANDLFLRRLPSSKGSSLDFGPHALLVVVGLFVALLFVSEVGQFLLAQRRISTGTKGNFVVLPWLRYFGTPQFFTKEYRYLAKTLQRFPGSWFRFRVRENDVVIISGNEARNFFFKCESLAYLEGYFLLHPNMKYLVPDAYTEGKDGFGWLLKQFAHTDVLKHFLAPIASDAQSFVAQLGTEGTMDPFADLDQAVFTVSTRIAAGRDIADSPLRRAELHRALAWLRAGSTPHALILPWLPTPARFRGVLGGLKLHRILSEVFLRRRRSARGEVARDVMQGLVDEDVGATQASVLTIMAILAAHENTSAILAWLLITLLQHPPWLAAVRAEIDAFLTTHHVASPARSPASPASPPSPPTPASPGTHSPSDIPLSAWERALPTLDRCLHEALRLYMNVPLIRKNAGPDAVVAGRTIASGDYVMYMMEDAHMDARAYPEPAKFDPLRERKPGFVAWGAGTHPCAGQRLARLVIKAFVATLLWNYEMELVDARGEPLKAAPQPVTGLFSVLKPDVDVRVRYKERVYYNARTPA